VSEQTAEHGAGHNEQHGKKKDLFSGNGKWYLIGGLGLVAVLVFLFVKRSNSNASSNTSGTGTSTGTLDATTQAELQSALQAVSSGAYNNYGYSGYQSSGPMQPTGPSGTSSVPSTNNSGSVAVSMPNGQLGWESIVFPDAAAVSSWNAWNAAQTAPGSRSGINNELTSLGATGMVPIATYNASAPIGSAQNTGNPLDYQ
jgi:hypothetical protein